MRKFVWAGTAVVVMSAAAVYLAADYAAQYPHSWIGRCAIVAGSIGSQCNPFVGLGASVAHPAANGCEPGVCQIVQKPDPAAIAQEEPACEGEADDVNETIRVEPQPAFILPFEGEESSTVPPSEETPEPNFSPAEESEVPAAVAAPAGEDEEAPPPMPYIADEESPCAKCSKTSTGCCAQGECAKTVATGCCDKGDSAKTVATGCCDRGDGTKTVTTGCCDKGDGAKTVATGCCDKGDCCKGEVGACCGQACCDWFVRFFGLPCCEKCGPNDPIISLPTAIRKVDAVTPTEDASTEEESTVPNDSSKNDDIPNAQEDPSYHHQYPSCPYTGCPYPYLRPTMTPPRIGPRNDTVRPDMEVRNQSVERLLHDSTRAVKQLAIDDGEESEPHPDVDTMEVRPTDVEKDPFSDVPF